MDRNRELFLEIYEKLDFHRIKDHPNILIAAGFWEDERYNAAKSCYKFMRAVDDMIDDHKAAYRMISFNEKDHFITGVNEWLDMAVKDPGKDNPVRVELAQTIEKFRIPLWPMEAFAKSMIYDIYNDGFATLDTFLEYSNGASVAPASIFVHLNSIRKVNNHYEEPLFDVKWASTPCAVFSYLVHIIRDFQKDQLNNLNYFPDDLIIKNNLSRKDLKDFADGRCVNSDFRNLVGSLYKVADEYQEKTFDVLKKIKPLLEPRYQLSLDIIFNLYMMVFERIDLNNGSFTTAELNPTTEETKERVYDTIMKFEAVN